MLKAIIKKAQSFNHSTKLILLVLQFLTGPPAYAATDYVFSGTNANFPPGCSGSNGNYTCTDNVSIAAADTITIETISFPTTITFNLSVLAGDGFKINESGSAANLTLKFKDALQMGSGFIINANLEGNSSIVMGADSIIHGEISTSPEGVVTTGANTTVFGNISTQTGVISIFANSHIHGNISSNNVGAITVAADSVVDGNVTSKTGAITLAFGTHVGGNVMSTEVGAIDMAASVTVLGEVSTLTGVIGMGADCTVGPISTKLTGGVGFGARVRVNGSISTVTGGIGGGADSIICGSMTSSLAGGVGTGAGTLVGGDVSANVGPITTGATNTIGGKGGVSTQNGPITIGASNILGGQVTAVVGTITLGEALQRGVTVPPIAGCPDTSGETSICENNVDKKIDKADFKNKPESPNYYLGQCNAPVCGTPEALATGAKTCTAPLPVEVDILPNIPQRLINQFIPVTGLVYCDDGGVKSDSDVMNATIKRANIVNAFTEKNDTINLTGMPTKVKYGVKAPTIGTMDISNATIKGGEAIGATLTGVTLNNVYIDTAADYVDVNGNLVTGNTTYIQVMGGTTKTTNATLKIEGGSITSGMITAGKDASKNPVRGSITTGNYDKDIINSNVVLTKGRRIQGTIVGATITNARTTTTTSNGVTSTVVDAGTITSGTMQGASKTFGTVVNATINNVKISSANHCFSSGTVGSRGQLNWKEVVQP